ncbi:MAG: FmdB family transcriptional regulator [Dehalococcoidia bacterium]|nr:FmdB family transcriptional regulator [Dehalococcoidia bacterium]
MPVYEYYCPTCKSSFEALRNISQYDSPMVCPSGHEETRKMLSTVAVLTARGGSFEDMAGGCACGGACACGGH